MGEAKTCPDCGRKLEMMTEESYFFRMSRYAEPLLAYYEANGEAILPKGRCNEILSFLRGGLRDQSISRTTISWGIPVPGDEKHVVYVWFDALINYLAAVGYPEENAPWQKYWPVVHHLVGKDIIRFHSVVWPAMLLALGVNPPKLVFAHGWWTVEGEKMSKSKGNVVDPFEMVKLYGRDSFRYFLLREVPFGLDGDFSELALVQRRNADLANDLGNLLNRTLQMVERYCGGTIPAVGAETELERDLAELVAATRRDVDSCMDRYAFDEALKNIWVLVGRGNKYIDDTMPWKLGKEEDAERLGTVLNTLCRVLRTVACLVAPFIPDSAARMMDQLGLDAESLSGGQGIPEWTADLSGVSVHRGDVLFPRIDLKAWEAEKADREARKGMLPDPGDHEPEIEVEQFRNCEFRVASVLAVEPVPKADKLYKLELDLGYERRTIVSGIREFYAPEELVGRKIIVICNLKPAKLRGVLSNGMLLAAETADGEGLALLTVDRDIAPGSRIH